MSLDYVCYTVSYVDIFYIVLSTLRLIKTLTSIDNILLQIILKTQV